MASVTRPNVGFPLRSSTVRVEPPRGLLGFGFGEVWAYFIAWCDVNIRYKLIAIGVLWVAMQPVLTTPFVIQFWMLPLLSPILLCSFPRAFAGVMD